MGVAMQAEGNEALEKKLSKRLSEYRKDYDSARARIIERQAAKLKFQHINDFEIMRLASLIDDYKKSQNRMLTRLGQLIGLYYPSRYRDIHDYSVLARLFEENRMQKDALKMKMGDDMKGFLKNISNSALKVQDDIESAEALMEKLLEKNYASFTLLATPKIAYRMIRKAGSFKAVATMSASKLQLLGAEKALFRHLKNNKQQPPKYGILHEHPLMAKVARKNHGKFARLLADKMIIAARMDYFGSNNSGYAKKMLKEIEGKAKEYS